MADTLEVAEQPVTMTQVPVSEKAQDPFADWSETPIQPVKTEAIPVVPPAPAAQTTPAAPTAPTTTEDETFDEADYLRTNFGWESRESARAEVERLRNLEKNPPKEEIKFNDDESRRIFDLIKSGKKSEVRQYLDQQDRLDRLAQMDLSKVDQASDILKAHMQFKYPDLTSEQVDRRISKMFPIPSKPANNLDLTPEENQAAMEEWQRQVQGIEQDMIIEAKIVRPELAKFKSELALPDIPNQVDPAVAEQQQKELQQWQTQRANYLNALKNDLKNFNGVTVTYKDEEVEYPIPFTPTEEEKTALLNELQDFNRDKFFDERWFDKDGNPKIKDIADDIYFLKNKEKILQKLVSESGQKRLAALKKDRSNITIGTQPQSTWNPDNATEQEKQERAIWSA